MSTYIKSGYAAKAEAVEKHNREQEAILLCEPYTSNRKRFEAIITRLEQLTGRTNELVNAVLDYKPLFDLTLAKSLRKLCESVSGLRVEVDQNRFNAGYSLALYMGDQLVVFLISRSSNQVAESIGGNRSMMDMPDRKVLIFKSTEDYKNYKPASIAPYNIYMGY